MRHIPNTNLVFVHIPKTAGQAVKDFFGLSLKPSAHGISEKEYLNDGFIRFCCVRHPVERFVSAYKYHLHMLSTNPDKPIRKMIADNGLRVCINEFVRYVIGAGIDINRDLHFRRQIWWIANARPQIIMRHESLASDLNIIKNIYCGGG